MAADYSRVFPSSFDAETPDGAPHYKIPTARPYRRSRRHRRASLCSCCCCCYACASIAILLLLLLLAASVLYFLLAPKAPNFSVTRVYISEFTMTAEPVVQSKAATTKAAFYLQSDVNFTVETENPNKKIGIYYERVNVELEDEEGGEKMGEGWVPSFYVGEKERKRMEVRVRGEDRAVSEAMAWRVRQEQSRSMGMEVMAEAMVRVRVWGWRSPSLKVLVTCQIQISPPRPHSGAHLISKSCTPKLPSFWQQVASH